MAATASTTSPPAKKPQWQPRLWQGCDFFAWLRMLRRNRAAVQWPYLYIAAIDTFASLFNTTMGLLEVAIYGRALRRTELKDEPIFILGHWRTGTTLLHDLLICDDRFGFPNTYQCVSPCHFILTERVLSRVLKVLEPKQRPMDNVRMGFDRPQEDEFALALLTGDASPYLSLAFPNHPPQCLEYLDLVDVTSSQRRRWERTFRGFLRRVTYKVRKRLVLKSPGHTARIPVLKAMFPNALFIHIVRDPYIVFASTMNLWRTLQRAQGLQTPTFAGLEEFVFATFVRMYERFEEGKKLLSPEQFYELKYEDLTRDPVGELKKAYDHLGLGGFDRIVPQLHAYLATIKDYETNRYELTDAQREEVTRRWGDVIRRYGYDRSSSIMAK